MSRADSPLRDRVVFVVGARRSGTNWLQRVLCAHPRLVAVPSESFLFAEGIAPLRRRFQHAAANVSTTGFVYMDREALADALRDLCDAVFLGLRDALRPGAEWVVERTPDHVRHLPLIAEIYPDARVVHIIRDGRDVARSLLSQEWGPASIAAAAEEWSGAVRAGREAAPTLAHYIEVRYERLLADPEAELRSLFSWLGIALDPEATELVLAEARARYNVDPATGSVGAGKWRESFSPDDLRAFETVAGPLLAELGYGEAPGTVTPPAPASPPASGSPARRWADRGLVLTRARTAAATLLGRSAPPAEDLALATAVLHLAERFLGHVVEGAFERAAGMLRPTAMVRLVAPEGDWRGRGDAAKQRLVEALASDPALRRPRLRSEIHPAAPLATAVLAFDTAEGPRHRVFVIGGDRGALTYLVYYRLDAGAP